MLCELIVDLAVFSKREPLKQGGLSTNGADAVSGQPGFATLPSSRRRRRLWWEDEGVGSLCSMDVYMSARGRRSRRRINRRCAGRSVDSREDHLCHQSIVMVPSSSSRTIGSWTTDNLAIPLGETSVAALLLSSSSTLPRLLICSMSRPAASPSRLRLVEAEGGAAVSPLVLVIAWLAGLVLMGMWRMSGRRVNDVSVEGLSL